MQTQRKHAANTHSKPVSLDSVFQAVEHWRKNKSKYGTHIPDSVWLLIFQLEETYSVDKIRQMFAISKKTYLNKRSELKGNINPHHSRETHSGLTNTFSEAIVSDTASQSPWPDETQPLNSSSIEPLIDTEDNPSTYLDFSTVIVEFIRADGQRMKIHTTDKSFRELMRVFFEEGRTAS